MFNSKLMIPSKEQRKSQINLLNFMEHEHRRNSKEFLFPDDNLLHKRRSSAQVDQHSGTQSEDDDNASYEVKAKKKIS